MSHNNFIVTTDADCKHPLTWLKTIASFYEEKRSAFIAAPVVLQNDSSVLQIFQALDFLVLQGITGASVTRKFIPCATGPILPMKKTFSTK